MAAAQWRAEGRMMADGRPGEPGRRAIY